MTLLVSGCSFTYGDELDNIEEERWSTHLGKLLNMEVINVAKPGNSNKAIWRSVKEQLLNQNDITHLLVLWSALERVEILNLDYHHQYDLQSGESIQELSNNFRSPNPFTQMSPARLDVYPFRLLKEQMQTYYNELYSHEGAILDSFFYMKDVYNTCAMLGIEPYGGVFHQAVNYSIAKTFTKTRLKNYGDRLIRIHGKYKDMLDGFDDKQKIGMVEHNQDDAFSRPRPQYLSFNEFTETHKYEKKPGGHPGPEAHKGYAEYLFEEIFNNG
jgi:hypothetical protein